jgi:hypothetical protein
MRSQRWINHIRLGNTEEDNLEDGKMVLEQLESALFYDDDRGEMPPPYTTMVTLTRTQAARDSCSVPLPSTMLPLISAFGSGSTSIDNATSDFGFWLWLHYNMEAHGKILVMQRGRKVDRNQNNRFSFSTTLYAIDFSSV